MIKYWIGVDKWMEILLYISAAVAAASLLLIAVFVIIAVKNATKMMKEVSNTMDRMENKISGITAKSDELVERTNRIATDVENKVQRLESVSQSAQYIGESAENLKSSFSSISRQIATPAPKYNAVMQKLTALTETASRMYFKFKEVKQYEQTNVQQEVKQLPTPLKID